MRHTTPNNERKEGWEWSVARHWRASKRVCCVYEGKTGLDFADNRTGSSRPCLVWGRSSPRQQHSPPCDSAISLPHTASRSIVNLVLSYCLFPPPPRFRRYIPLASDSVQCSNYSTPRFIFESLFKKRERKMQAAQQSWGMRLFIKPSWRELEKD